MRCTVIMQAQNKYESKLAIKIRTQQAIRAGSVRLLRDPREECVWVTDMFHSSSSL